MTDSRSSTPFLDRYRHVERLRQARAAAGIWFKHCQTPGVLQAQAWRAAAIMARSL